MAAYPVTVNVCVCSGSVCLFLQYLLQTVREGEQFLHQVRFFFNSAKGMETFRRCPAYVPLQAVDGVRALLQDFQRAGSPSFDGFKRCWASSQLPVLLSTALRRPAKARAPAPNVDAGEGEGQAAHEPSTAKDKHAKTICLRHLYAAATSFFPGLWDGGADGEGAENTAEASGSKVLEETMVQSGVLFTLFCLYFGQPSDHAKEPVPMTPAGWKHLLHLCEKAKMQMHGVYVYVYVCVCVGVCVCVCVCGCM